MEENTEKEGTHIQFIGSPFRTDTTEEFKNYKLMGKATGVDLNHCFFLAEKHCKKFDKRYKGCKIVENDKVTKDIIKSTGKEYISVEFYENN